MKLSGRQRKGLMHSIVKWEKITDGTGVDEGAHDCPLCTNYWLGGCKRCPVALTTKEAHCMDTPYCAWEAHQSGYHYSGLGVTKRIEDGCGTCVALALAERDFLRKILADAT